MKPEYLGLIIGGAIPAIMFALSGVLQKVGSNAGIGVGPFLVATGVAIVGCGGVLWHQLPARPITSTGVLASFGMGITWALGVGCVVYALGKYAVPLAKLVPLYNTNTLFAILLSLAIFAEWQQVHVWKLLAGAILIIVGSILAASA